MVVKATNTKEKIWTEYGNIIDGTKRLLFGSSHWSVKFIYREANNIAHKLAKLAFTFSKEKVRIEDGPIHITNSILSKKYCND